MQDIELQPYRVALQEARKSFDRSSKRLREITSEQQRLNDEISRLRKTITALAAQCSESPYIDSLGITDACIEVMASFKETVNTQDVLRGLEEIGFDLSNQKNAAASVHTVLTRLAAKEKITKVEEDGSVSWRGPNYDEAWDNIPF